MIAAAQLAGVHEMIQGLPRATIRRLAKAAVHCRVGNASAIGLARAIYDIACAGGAGRANSNLDSDGEAALLNAINTLKEAKRTVIVVTHKTTFSPWRTRLC